MGMIQYDFPNGWSLSISDDADFTINIYPTWIHEDATDQSDVIKRLLSHLDIKSRPAIDLREVLKIMERRGDYFEVKTAMEALNIMNSVAARPLEPFRHQINRQLAESLSRRGLP